VSRRHFLWRGKVRYNTGGRFEYNWVGAGNINPQADAGTAWRADTYYTASHAYLLPTRRPAVIPLLVASPQTSSFLSTLPTCNNHGRTDMVTIRSKVCGAGGQQRASTHPRLIRTDYFVHARGTTMTLTFTWVSHAHHSRKKTCSIFVTPTTLSLRTARRNPDSFSCRPTAKTHQFILSYHRPPLDRHAMSPVRHISYTSHPIYKIPRTHPLAFGSGTDHVSLCLTSSGRMSRA
jgi:hypothetical protein